jgi:hypothetical protein
MGAMLVAPMQNLKLSRWQPQSQHAYNTDSNLFLLMRLCSAAERTMGLDNSIEGVFRWQNFWEKIHVALSLLFGKICPTMD